MDSVSLDDCVSERPPPVSYGSAPVYNAVTDSWNVICRMNKKRRHFFPAVLPLDRVIAVGGEGHKDIDSVEIVPIL